MWFPFQLLLVTLLLLTLLFLSWFIVWRLILSKLTWFQEIFGMKSSKALELAALKKRKKQQANTFILTRSGEQAEKNRKQVKQQALALQLGRNQPTTTPISGSTILTPPTTTAATNTRPYDPTSSTSTLPSTDTTPERNALTQRQHRRRSDSNSTSLTSHTPHQPPSTFDSITPAHLPTSSTLHMSDASAAALAAEALHRRYAQSSSSSSSSLVSSVAPTPGHRPQATSSTTNPKPSSSSPASTKQTIGGSGWLQRAAIIEDYQPNK